MSRARTRVCDQNSEIFNANFKVRDQPIAHPIVHMCLPCEEHTSGTPLYRVKYNVMIFHIQEVPIHELACLPETYICVVQLEKTLKINL